MSAASQPARPSAEVAPAPTARDDIAAAPSRAAPDGLAALAAINTAASPATGVRQPDGRLLLDEENSYRQLGFGFPWWKKWLILTAIFLVQLSMNWNAAIYGNAIAGLKEEFGVGDGLVRIGQMVFLVAYAFGCELWAPWSEELGRKWVLQISLLLVNVWQIGCALAPNFTAVIIFRGLGGLSSAGGSVTLGIVADMWEPNEHQFAVAYVVLSSVLGSIIAPIAGGFITAHLSWQWVFWISLAFGGVAQLLHLFVPETRSEVLLDRRAQHLRATGEEPDAWGPMEIRGTFWQRITWGEVAAISWRPFRFLLTEPIVTFLSLLSGFSDALIFTGLDSFPLVLSKWNFTVVQVGLSFIPLMIGYFIAYGSFLPVYTKDIQVLKDAPETFKPERRLWWLLYLVPLEPIGLFILGWAALGPPQVHWIAPMIATGLIGIANFAIYMATIDYMVAAYGGFAASATGGNGFCRDFLAGIAALYARPLYSNIAPGTRWTLAIPSFILAGVGLLLCIPVYVFYVWGPWFRARSAEAKRLAAKREEGREKREEAIRDSREGTPRSSRHASRAVSRRASLDDVSSVGESKQPETPQTPGVMGKDTFHA